MKVSQYKGKNQFLLQDSDYMYFQSYNSIIAKLHKTSGILTLGKDWEYSKTTRKYLYQFLNEYTRFTNVSKKEIEQLIKDKTIMIDNNL